MQAVESGRLLVTGADGFIGSHLVEEALASGFLVRAFCLYNSRGSAGWLDESEVATQALTEGALEVVLGDLRDLGSVESAVSGADAVLHLGALIAIPYSYAAPRSYVDTNITGTLNVLEAARRLGTSRVVQVSTSEVYGTPSTVPIRESHALRAQSPYSATKIAADKLCESYAHSFGTPVVTVRPFNTYGPRQSTRAVLPTILTQMLNGADELRLGSTSPRRDFTFVTDTCAGLLAGLAADLEAGDVVHLGTGRSVSIGELVELCREITGSKSRVTVEHARVRPGGSEVQVLLSDPSLALEKLGWTAGVDLHEGVERTVRWMRHRPARDDGSVYRL